MAFASLGVNHRKQILPSSARSLESPVSSLGERGGGGEQDSPPGWPGVTRSPQVFSHGGMIHKGLRDRLDFLEILQSGDTSTPE